MNGKLDTEALLEHGGFMRALAKGLLFDDARADDVVQEAWLAALRRPPRQPDRARAWLATVVRNFARRAHRDESRRRRRERAAAPPSGEVPSTEEILEREEARRRVVLAVLGLEEPYRSTIVLRFLEEQPPREVARRLGVPVETVRTRVRRALALLRTQLDAEQGGDRRAWSLALIPLAAASGKSALGAGALVSGALVMSTKTKVAALAAVVAVGLVAFWLASGGTGGRSEDRARNPMQRDAVAPPPDAGKTDAAGADDARPDKDARAAAVEPPPPADATVVGRVVAGGLPLAGAHVYLLRGTTLVARVAATDATGSFHFKHSGTLTVGAAHPKHGPRRVEITARRGEVTNVVLALPAAPFVDVEVVDGRTGRPVAEAEILVLSSGAQGEAFNVALEGLLEGDGGFGALVRKYDVFDSLGQMFDLFKGRTRLNIAPVTTDARGRARLEGLLTKVFKAVVSHPAYPAQLVQHERADATDAVRVELFAGASLTVIAPRFDGRPAVGHVCELDRATIFPLPGGRTRFDEYGKAHFKVLRPGSYFVTVSKDGVWNLSITTEEKPDKDGEPVIVRSANVGRNAGAVLLRRRVQVEDGEAKVLDLSEVRGAKITGRVVADRQLAKPWMVVLASGPDLSEEIATTGTDREGRFTFDKVAPGRYRVSAVAVQGGVGAVRADCTVAPHDEEVNVVLHAQVGDVSGRVTGPEGKPLAKATIFAIARGTAHRIAHREPRRFEDLMSFLVAMTESGADGTYVLEGVPTGAYYLFCGKDNALARIEFELGEGRRRRVDVRLDATHLHRVTVRLATSDGKPVPGRVLPRGAAGGVLTSFALSDDLEQEPATSHVFLLQEGRYLLDLYARDHAPRRSVVLDVNGVEDKVVRLSPGVPVTLEVVDRDGKRVARRLLEIRDRNDLRVPRGTQPMDVLLQQAQWRTDADGRVMLAHVGPGRYTVHLDDRRIGEFVVDRTAVTKRIRIE